MVGGLYAEVFGSVTRMFEGAAPDPLDQFGLEDLLASEERSERSAVFAVAEAQGRTGAVTDVISRVALAGLQPSPGTRYAGQLVAGSLQSPWLVALLGAGDDADDLIVVDDHGAACEFRRADLSPIVSELDPAYLMGFSAESGGGRVLGLCDIEDIKARSRIACAAEILGACEAMLEDAVTYAGTRRQFGAPLASFQAVAHSLAWASTELHQLRALLAVCLNEDPLRAPDHTLAAATKSLAGTVSQRVAQTCLQVAGGMGFTWEYSHNALHRRVLALDAVDGNAEMLNAELGRRLRQGDGNVAQLAAISLSSLGTASQATTN
jgi:Acyl-CoA dehydrogenase, C-terminal domain